MNDFPDYETAAETLTEFPFDEENDWVKDRARIKARKAVDAALGDTALYRLTEHAVVLDAGRDEFVIDGIVTQVWPKDSDDE